RAWWIGSALVLLPALLSKEMAITLPAVLLLLTYRSGAQVLRFEERIRLLAPYGVAALIYGGMRVHALGFLASNQVPATAGMFDWITLGFRAFGEYVLLSFVPYPLIAYRMVPLHLADRLGTTLLGAAFVLALAGLAWKLRKRFLDGLLWYTAFFVMLVPVFYFRGISNALMSDRYLYIPSIMTVLFGLSLLQRSQSKAWVWAAWAVAAVFAGGSVLRNQDWSTRERLYTRTIEQEPHVGVFHLSMANLVLQRGEDPLVLYHLTQAEKNLNDPAYAPVQYDAYNLHIAMTAVLLRSGQVDAAISHLELAAKANPTGEWVAIYRGAIRMAKYEDDAGAVALIEGAIKINPNNEAAYDFLGTAYYNLGRYAEALAAFQRAVALKPDFAVARQHLTLVQQNYPQ
ncbi:MAG: hypothetical protein RL328_474, partial [Acidobacteriota bacterium]